MDNPVLTNVPLSSAATLHIRPAAPCEYSAVRVFYHSLIDAMKDAVYKPGWKKQVYPSDDYLQDAVNRQELCIGQIDGRIVSAMIVNHAYNASYDHAAWITAARPGEITVIHALGVDPLHSGKGIATALVNKVIGLARQSHQKAIRLDVLSGNLPAERLYTRIGFQHTDTIQMYYEDTGWTDFKLYEYLLR